MDMETTPAVIIPHDQVTSFDAQRQEIQLNFSPSVATDTSITPLDGSFIRRAINDSPQSIERHTENSILVPFIGDVHEDDKVTSSWIFPTAALAKSEIADGVDKLDNVVPDKQEKLSGSADTNFLLGNTAPTKSFGNHLAGEDIAFLPPTTMDSDTATLFHLDPVITIPQDGSFVTNRKTPIGHSSPSDSRDIDFSPAGCAMETASPPLPGSFEQTTIEEKKSLNHDIDVAPDLSGIDMPTSPPPNQGTFGGKHLSTSPDVTGNSHDETPRKKQDREINFSPGASGMITGPPPHQGSYTPNRHFSPVQTNSAQQEINVLPDNIGKDMLLLPAPPQGSYVVKINDVANEPTETPRKRISTLSPLQDEKHVAEQQDEREDPSLHLRDSWIFPKVPGTPERDINFSPGASDMETAAPPCRGSYVEGPHSTPPRCHTAQLEINVIPDLAGKFMPTSPPPNQGSFFGQQQKQRHPSQNETNNDNKNTNSLECEGISYKLILPRSMSHANEDIDFSPGELYSNETTHIPQPGRFPLRNSDQTKTNDQPTNLDDDDDDDPMESDQDLWRSKRLWETAKIKQTANSSAIATDAIRQTESHDSEGQVIIPGEGSDSNSLADSIQKVGALLDSAYEIQPVDSNEEAADLSNSIQKIGALLGSAHFGESTVSPEECAPSPFQVPQPSDDITGEKTSDLLDDSHWDDDQILEDREVSHSESIVELGPLPKFTTRSDSKVLDDDVTVQIGNTTKQHQGRKKLNEENNQYENSISTVDRLMDDMQGVTKPIPPVDDDEYAPDDSMAKLEALLDEALDAPMEESDNISNRLSRNVVGVTTTDISLDDEYVPNDSIAKLEAILDEELNRPMESTLKKSNDTIEMDNDDEPYVPVDSIAALEASLDKALDAPFASNHGVSKLCSAAEEDALSDSMSALDDLLEQALNDEVEITFEPTEEEIKAPAKDVRSAAVSTVTSKPKVSATGNRFTRRPLTADVKTKLNSQPNQRNLPQDLPVGRKPAIPRFRVTKKVPKTVAEETQPLPTKKPAVPRFRGEKTAPKPDKKASNKSGALPAAKKSAMVELSKERDKDKERTTRTRKILSRFTPWTKRVTEKAKEETTAQSQIPTFTPAESRNKERTAPVRLFATRTTLSRRMEDDDSSMSISLGSSRSINTTDRQFKSKASAGSRKHQVELTGLPTIGKHSDHYTLSPLARSISSLSSTCSVTNFRSPRREGIRGCQNKFNPYLHDVRGPCELCVFFLSEEDKAALDTHGRHIRVMFTTGGCCQSCEIFPRSFDDRPARLCRMCYSNSHRKVHERYSSSRFRRVITRTSMGPEST